MKMCPFIIRLLNFTWHFGLLQRFQIIFLGSLKGITNEPPREKTNNLHRRKQKLISAFVFATRIVQFLFYLNPKFQASSSFMSLYRSVCVEPVRKPHCWFSHEAAQMLCHPLCTSHL